MVNANGRTKSTSNYDKSVLVVSVFQEDMYGITCNVIVSPSVMEGFTQAALTLLIQTVWRMHVTL